MNRRRSTKKALVSPELATLQYDLQNPDLDFGPVYRAKVRQQEEADAQASLKEEAEAKEKGFENAENAKARRNESKTKDKQNDEPVSNYANKHSASVEESRAFKSIYDYLDEERNKINLHFFNPVNIEDPKDYNYVIDRASQVYNSRQKNTAEAAADREIQRLYGDEINDYNKRFEEAKENDRIANQQYGLGNIDTASFIKDLWESSDTYQRIQQTRDYILQNYTPNEALANKVLDWGTSLYNPLYVKASDYTNRLNLYKALKNDYDKALKALHDREQYFYLHRSDSGADIAIASDDLHRLLKLVVDQKSRQLMSAEKALASGFESKEKYEHDLNFFGNLIRTQGLPSTKNELAKYTEHIIDSLGLMDVLYNEDGELNNNFVGVGYASDEEIKQSAKAAADYFKSSAFESGIDVLDEYIEKMKQDVQMKKEMYDHLANNDLRYAQERDNLQKAERILEKAQHHKQLNNVVKRADGFWTKQTAINIGYGIAEKVKDPGLWTLGISDLIDSKTEANLADKIKGGQKLTVSEKALANSLAIESVMHQNYGEYEKTMGFKAGQVATESLKFMAEMALTRGVSSKLESPGKVAMKNAANKYIRKFGADGFKNILGRNLVKIPGLTKVIGGDAVYSLILANTLQAPSTITEATKLLTGNIVPGVDADGNLTITDYEGSKSLLTSWYEAEARAATENMSEMIGEYGIGALLKYPIKYFGKQAIKNSNMLLGAFIKGSSVIDNAQQLIDRILPTKAISSFVKPVGSFIKAGHYSGIVGETAEEYYGNAMLHLLGVSDGTKTVVDENGNKKTVKTSFWEEVDPTTELGKLTFLDIIGGIALSTGFLGAGSMLNYARITHNYNKSKQRLTDYIGKENVEKMEDAISQANSANVAATANTIIRGMSNSRDREAFIDFYENLMRFHGASLADQKIKESTDLSTYERAKRDAEANGYSIQYNSQRTDLQRAVDSLRQYTERQLGIDDGLLDETIESNGGAAEFIQYLRDTGNSEMATSVMAYNNAKTQYEASMRRLMDDIDEDLTNNEQWVNRLSNNAGKVIVGTIKGGDLKVFIKSGTRVVDGEIKAGNDDMTIVNRDGSVEIVNADQLEDEFEEISANELKHDLDIDTYRLASVGFDISNTSSKIGILIQMSNGRIGTIINRLSDGRIMYSVNDPSTNTEVVRITEPNVTESDLIKRWADSYNEEFKNNEIKKAQRQFNLELDKTALVIATNELREYIKGVKERERQDMETKHGKAITYASGVITSNSVNSVLDDIENTNGMFISRYDQAFRKVGVTVDASNWKRLGRLIMAFKRGLLTRKQFKEILCDGSTNMSKRAKEDLLNISVDSYGNITWWKDQDDTNTYTHVDTNEYDLSEELLEDSEKLIEESINEESKRLNSREERKKRGEVGRKVAKQKRAEKKKTRKQILAEKTKLNAANVPQKVNEQISKHSEPAPEPTPADITTFVVNEAQFPNQKSSLEKLNKRVEWTDANVLRDQTTSHNYFIMLNGKRVMFTRVHGILDDQYENVARVTELNAAIKDLIEAYNDDGINGLKTAISKLLGEDKKKESDIYISYLEDNPEEYREVIGGAANVAVSTNVNKSVAYGNYIDELCRKFFSGELITPEYIFENGTPIKDLMKVTVSEEERKRGIKSTLETFIDLCKNIKAIYDALGWELVSERAVFTYLAYDEKLGKNVRIAGETDMIGVDRLGNYHIIDFKTSYKNFEDYIKNEKVANDFESIRKGLTVDGSKLIRSAKEYYTDQQTMYSIMVEYTLEGNVDSIEILPFKLDYDYNLPRVWFDNIDNTRVVLSNDGSFQYNIKVPQRITLTKNGNVISRFSETRSEKAVAAKNKLIDAINNLSSVELQSEVDNLPQDQKEDVKSRRNAINERIKNVIEASSLVITEDDCNKLIEQINGIKQELEDLLDYVQQKVEDNEKAIAESERLQKQEEGELQSYDAWILQQASALTKWAADWKAAFERDYDRLKNLYAYVEKWAKDHNTDYAVLPELMKLFDLLISNLKFMIEFDNEVLGTTSGRILGLDIDNIAKVTSLIDLITNNVYEYTPVPPITPPTSIAEYSEPKEAWKQTNGLFKDPYKDSNGVSSSVATDDSTLKLTDVTKNADFIDNSEFRVLLNNGRLFIQITYGGHTYTPVRFFHAKTKEGEMLNNRMFDAVKYAGSNQKVVITGGIKRSFGTFIVKQEGQYKTAHEHGIIAIKDGEPGINIYDIEYSATQHTIGITYTRDIQNGTTSIPVTEVRVPQEEDVAKAKFERQKQSAGWITDKATGAKRRMLPDSPYALSFGSAIYTYSNVNDRKPKSSGIFVFMHNLGYTDDPKCSVPVTMRHSYISENDADFIVDALLGEYNGLVKRRIVAASQNNPLGFSTSTELVKGFGGNVVIGGQTIDVSIADILDMLIPVKGCPSYEALASRQDPTLKMPVYLNLDNVNETGEVLIIGNVEGDGVELKLRSYNIKTNEGIRDFKNHLLKIERNMNMNGFAQMRLGNIGAKTDQYGYPLPLSNNPTGGITLKKYVEQHGTLRFGNSCIQFDKDDFSNPAVQGDTNGISGMGWYLKNGFLECMYNGVEDPLIRIENDAQISIVDDVVVHPLDQKATAKQQEIVKQSIENSVAQTLQQDMSTILWQDLEERNSGSSYSPDDFGFTKTLQQKNPNNPIDKNKALANLERILGSSVPVKFQPTVIAAAKCGASVVGLCDADGILLSEAAEAGVEYHEAFHRVMELLFTPELRLKAYNKFRKAKEGRQNLTDKQIAEMFADEFMYYAMNEPTIKLHWNILKMLNEIKEWCGMWKKIGSYNLFRMYAAINSGEYADVQPDERSKELFLKYTNGKGYAYTTNGHNFEHIINGVHYKKLLNFIAMSFLHPSIQKVNLDGSNLDEFKLDENLLIREQHNIDNPVIEDTSATWPINFFTEFMANAPESTRLALQEMLDNFNVIKQDLAAYISLFATDYKIKYEQDNYSKKEGADTTGGQFDGDRSTTSEEDIYDSWLDDHIKESYEFAPITRMTERTKFFFSAIVKKRLTDNGWQFELNELGLPEMYDAKYSFITVLNEVADCRSIPEMYDKMTKLGEHDPLFNTVAARFGKLWEKVLNGNADADEQALVVQIFTQLKSTTSEFVLAKGIHKKNGEYDVQLEKTDQSYNAGQYVRDWAQSFAIGGCKFFRQIEDGSYKMNGNFDARVFGIVVSLMTAIQKNIVNGVYKTIDEIDKAKRQYLFYLNSLGIPFTKEMLDKYLWSVYADVGVKGLKTFFEQNRNDINEFYKKISSLNKNGLLNITEDGRVDAGNRLPLDKHFAKDRFLTTLANAKYMWHRAHDQMSVLIANNAKAYTKSENNLITDRLDEIMYDEEAQRKLMSDVYNYNADKNEGSIILKNRGTKLRFVTMGGFKTGEYGSTGIDYLQQSKREDYIGKAVALLDGHILSPTLSDKKTWGFIAGLEEKMSEFGYNRMTGEQFFDLLVIDENGNIKDFYIPDTVVNQMLEYAECENASVKHILSQIGVDENGNRKWLIPENHLVANFHESKLWIKDGKVYNKKKNAPKDAIEVNPVQGARYTSLLGVYQDGKFVEFNQILDENGNYKDELSNFNTAQQVFFSKPIEEKQKMIREVLLLNVRKELRAVEDLGLIRRKAVGTNTKEVLFTYENVGLPSSRLSQIEDKIMSGFTPEQKANITVAQKEAYKSLAIVSFIADVTNKHIISMQEFERMFSGNPSFFKFGYDSGGHLIDRTIDQSKRLGGLISTGTNNCLDIPGLPTEYRCVEIDNPMMQAAHIDKIKKDIYDGELRSGYLRYLLEQNELSYDDSSDDSAIPTDNKVTAKTIADKVDNMSIEEIESAMEGLPLLDVLKAVAKSKAKKFEDIDIADGAAYITDEMCENLLKMVGSWSKEIEQAFRILRGQEINPKTGKPYTVSDSRATGAYNKIVTTVIGTLKYTAYGYRFLDGLAVPYYNKMALFPLFKNMCTGNMAKVYKAAKEQNIDMIMINSAVKVGSQSKYEVKDWDNLEFDKNAYVQKYSYLRKQFNTDPKEQELMAIKTQMMKVVMAAMIPGRSYIINGEEKSATQVRDDIMDALNRISDIGMRELIDKFFKDGKLDVKAFSNILQEELLSRGATKELLDGCEMSGDKMNLTLDAMSGMNWIQSILVAMVNRRVIDVNAPGKAFYLRSVWGMEDDPEATGATVVMDDDDLPPSINGGKKLEVLNNVGSMDCVLSIDFFAEILKGTKAEHADFESQRKYLIRKGIIGPNAKANMIGYRVPTQAISSIHALRCVDVLPTVRDTIILPAEFTKITGSDYDIDKIFITMKHYQRIVDEERSTKNEIHHKTTDVFDEEKDPEKYYCNKLIDCQLTLLTDERVFNQLNGSIDDDTELLTSIVNDLEEGENTATLESYNVSTLSFQSNTRDKFVTGKVGIGPFALNNNSHILTMLYGIKFREGFSNILDALGLRNLSSAMDRDNKSIMSWLSGLINAHVDVAKDPYISRLNVNPYTYNLVNLLIRSGLGKTTFYFTTQPIMKQLASVYNAASGVYMIEEGLSKTLAQRKEINDAIVRYVQSNTGKRPGSADDAIDTFKRNFKADHGMDVMDAIKILFSKECGVLHDIAKGGKVEDLKNKIDEQYSLNSDLKLSFYEVQMLVVIANEEFKLPAEKLSDIVKFSKIDTKKQGKNMSEIRSYLRGVKRTFDSYDAYNTFENIGNLYKNSYIKTKTDNAISTFVSILGSMSIAATSQFDNIVTGILHGNEYAARNANTINKITKSILAQIKAKFFFDQENGYCKVNDISYRGLIDGKDCIYNRLLRIKSAIMSQPEYAEYRDSAGNPINYLLLVLTSGYTTDVPNGRFNTAKFVQIASITQSDEINPQDLITAWDNLLHDDQHPELQLFARDLVVYAFFTSADNGGNRDLFKYVPNSWKYESGYADWMEKALEDFKNGSYAWTEDDTRDVYLNNTDDNFFVRYARKDKFTTVNNGDILAGIKITNQYKVIDGKAVQVPKVEFTYKSLSDAPIYIKIMEGSEADGVTTTRVYVKTDTGMINGRLYPIYSLVNPRKTQFKAGNYTYGYGTRIQPKSSTELVQFKLAALKQAQVAGIAVGDDGTVTTQAERNMELAIRDSIIAYNKFKEAQESNSHPETTRESVWVRSDTPYDRQYIQNDLQTLYIFTDNTDRTSGGQQYGDGWYKDKYGVGGFGSLNNPTTAQIRGLENAAPISTMKYFYKLHDGMTVAEARWKDSDIEEFKHVIDSEIEDIKKLWDSGKFTKIVSPARDGFFNSKIARISRDSEIGLYLENKLKELYDYVNNSLQSILPNSNTTINIYAGTGENVDLSNFAERPFTVTGAVIGEGTNTKFLFPTVEHAFLAAKVFYSDADNINEWFNRIKNAETPAEARKLGKQIPLLDSEDWDLYSSEIMKDLLKESFQQNPQALQKLLATGNATLTHTQDKGKWGTEFPRLLMEVRDELREQQLSTNGVLQSTLGTKLQPLLVYSDGSDIKGTGNIGYGAVFEYNGQLFGISGTENGEEVLRLKLLFPSAKFSNPTMEMLALTSVLEHIALSGIGEHIEINQDYKGAVNYNGLWYHSEGSDQREPKPWKAKEPYIAHLVERCETAIKQIEQNGGSVKIRWVKGHLTGNSEQARMNNAADAFAKNRSDFNTIDNAYKQNNTFDDSDQPDDAIKKCKNNKI